MFKKQLIGKSVLAGFFAALMLLPSNTLASDSGFGIDDFGLDAVENAVKGAVIGDVPSDDLNIILTQMVKEFMTDGKYVEDKSFTPCQRAAMAQAETGIRDLQQKWWQGGWFNLGYKAIKYSVVSAAGVVHEGLTNVVKEELRGKIAEVVEGVIREEEPEVVEINGSKICNMQRRVSWDKRTNTVEVLISGNCGCRRVTPRAFDLTNETLKEFVVRIVAKVKVGNIEIEEENPLIFWRERRVKAFLEVDKMDVAVKANCDCREDKPPTPEPSPILSTPSPSPISSTPIPTPSPTDSPPTPSPTASAQCEDGEFGTFSACQGACRNGECEHRLIGDLVFGKSCYSCKVKCDEGSFYKSDNCLNKCSDSQICVGDNNSCFKCEDRNSCPKINIEGRTSVTTFNSNETVTCNDSCKDNQICQGVEPNLVGGRTNCSYCKNKCNDGEYRSLSLCNAKCDEGFECKSSESAGCFICQKKDETTPTPFPPTPTPASTSQPTPTPTSTPSPTPTIAPTPTSQATNCPEAVRRIFDEYLGWFAPPLTFTSNSAKFYQGDYRCFDDATYQTFVVELIQEGMEDSSIQSLCPQLIYVGSQQIHISGEGKGAICHNQSDFTF